MEGSEGGDPATAGAGAAGDNTPANKTQCSNPEPQHQCEYCGQLFDSLSTAAEHEAVCRWQHEADCASGLAERPKRREGFRDLLKQITKMVGSQNIFITPRVPAPSMNIFETRTVFLSEAEDRVDNTELAGLNGPLFSSDKLFWDLDQKLYKNLSSLYHRADEDNSGMIDDEAELERLAHQVAIFAFTDMHMQVQCCHRAFC